MEVYEKMGYSAKTSRIMDILQFMGGVRAGMRI
jgi:hypothetical protein